MWIWGISQNVDLPWRLNDDIFTMHLSELSVDKPYTFVSDKMLRIHDFDWNLVPESGRPRADMCSD